MKDYTKTLCAKVDDQTYADFILLAEQHGINKSELVRNAILKELQSNKSTEMRENEIGILLPHYLPPVSTIQDTDKNSNHIYRSSVSSANSMRNQVTSGLMVAAVSVLLYFGISQMAHPR